MLPSGEASSFDALSVSKGQVPIPREAVLICKHFEGFHKLTVRAGQKLAVPYICPAGYWTIGFGHLCAAEHKPITLEEAENLLLKDLQASVLAALRACPVLAHEPEFRLAAVASFVFNLGAGRLQSSTLRRRINQQDWEGGAGEFLRWVHAGGRVLGGLLARRKAEAALFLGQGLGGLLDS